jgi:ABC-type sugar transport system substrate-binding protein/DNA-binding response OmpR family regulator
MHINYHFLLKKGQKTRKFLFFFVTFVTNTANIKLMMNKKLIVLFGVLSCLLFFSCGHQEKKYKIGVSQCSEDIWRDKLNRELKTSEYFNNSLKFEFLSAYDNDDKQIQQIDQFVSEGVHLLIVSPNQYNSVTPAIERAYDKGIPVILFDRKANTRKYTAFIGADNYAIGKTMGSHIAEQLAGHGNVVEIMGLKGSSPAIERHRGFMDAIRQYPGIHLLASLDGDWTRQSGTRVMEAFCTKYPAAYHQIDYVFGQNDRMSLGAYQFGDLRKRARFCGIDGLSTPDGGIEMVRKGILTATYIYPTQGERVAELALKILNRQHYQKENMLKASLVTKANVEIMAMQAEDIARQTGHLDALHHQVDSYLTRYNDQQIFLALTITLIILLIGAIMLTYRHYVDRLRMKDERQRMNEERLNFFTNVSHEIRTPLTLIADPIAHIVDRGHLEDDDFETLKSTNRNADKLMKLVSNILDFRKIKFDEAGNRIDTEELVSDNNASALVENDSHEEVQDSVEDDNRVSVLVIDDNDDIRNYLKSILRDTFHVILAKDGREGLNIAREQIPDIVISDIMMPVMNGLEMCSLLKSDIATSHIPVILLTAKSQDAQIAEGYESGADSYITKPFNSKVLLARIQNILKAQQRLHHQLAEESSGVLVRTKSGETSEQQQVENENTPTINVRDQQFITHLHDVILNHLADSDLGVEDIGSEMNLSRVQLYRKVKALTGSSPVELIRKARLNQALQLLKSGEKSISEVAYETGFTSPSYFSKCFKDEYGIQPGEVSKD